MSVFECGTCLIDLGRVAFVERVRECKICVVLQGALHPTDAQGQLINGQGRADCPYLSGEEAERFLEAWRQHAREGGRMAPHGSTIFESYNASGSDISRINLDYVAYVRGWPQQGITIIIPGIKAEDGPCLRGQEAQQFLKAWREHVEGGSST